MKIIKPIDIDDTSLVSSTIPEPDASQGELEFVQGSEYQVLPSPFTINSLVWNGIYYMATAHDGALRNFIHKFDASMTYVGTDFDLSPTIPIAGNIAFDPVKNGGTIYVAGNQGGGFSVYEYIYNATTKAYTGNSFITGIFNPLFGGVVVDGLIYFIGVENQPYEYEIRVFDSSGVVVRSIPIPLDSRGLFTDGVSLFFSDTAGKKIKNYSVDGVFISDVGDIPSRFAVMSSTNSPAGYIMADRTYTTTTSTEVANFDFDFNYQGQYKQGDEVILSSQHKRYQCASPTFDNPVDGIAKTPPTWVEMGPTNKWAMFSNLTSTVSKDGSLLVVEVSGSSVVNGVAGFDITGASEVNVTVTKAGIGEIYNKTVTLRAPPPESGWYSYLFDEVKQESSFVLTDLPAYGGSVIKFTFTGVDVCVGALVAGVTTNIGTVNHNSTLQLIDYSKKERDEFGNVNVIKRTSSKLVKFNLTIPTDDVGNSFAKIQDITTIPAVYIGLEEGADATRVFGYYEDYHNNISSPTVTTATLTVQGLA